MTGIVCNDDRFELIEKYKNKLIESTNIETSKDEMAVIDSILFRFWQMGWLGKLEDFDRQNAEIEGLQNELSVVKLKNSDLQSTYQALKIDLESMRSAANSYKMHYEEALTEIEKYKNIKTTMDEFWDILLKCKVANRKEKPTLEELADSIHQIEVNAIKEFAERFDSMLADYDDYDTLHIYEIKDRLDLVKEMEGESK